MFRESLTILFLLTIAATKSYYLPYRSGGVDYKKYDLYNDKIYVHTTTSVVFDTKGKNDCHLLLKKDASDYKNKVIEIVIGGWGNTKSVIRTAQQGSNKDTHKESGILSSSTYRTFWISWANNCIKVGKGSTVGSSEFMVWCGLSHAINYISIGYGYGSDGYFQFTIAENGNWGRWSSWSGCTRSCGTGAMSRSRSCNNPAPSGGGADCSGPASEGKTCNTRGCPATTKTYYLPYRRGGVDYKKYNLYNDKIYVHTTTSIVFDTKGKNDCHLLLKKDASDYNNNVIEIVIGGWSNKQSVIRTAQQGSHKDTHKESGILSSSTYRTFWISWANNCIKVGKGGSVGRRRFMSWCGLSHAINYISIGYGYGSDGYFRFTKS